MLVEQGPDGLPAGKIVGRAGIPASSLTFHLQQLLWAGLVNQWRTSRHLIYTPEPAAITSLLAYLAKEFCGSGPSPALARAPSTLDIQPDLGGPATSQKPPVC